MLPRQLRCPESARCGARNGPRFYVIFPVRDTRSADQRRARYGARSGTVVCPEMCPVKKHGVPGKKPWCAGKKPWCARKKPWCARKKTIVCPKWKPANGVRRADKTDPLRAHQGPPSHLPAHFWYSFWGGRHAFGHLSGTAAGTAPAFSGNASGTAPAERRLEAITMTGRSRISGTPFLGLGRGRA